jgi:hypothetical protein
MGLENDDETEGLEKLKKSKQKEKEKEKEKVLQDTLPSNESGKAIKQNIEALLPDKQRKRTSTDSLN